MLSKKQVGDQYLHYKFNKAMYIFMGKQYTVEKPWITREIKQYCRQAGVNVKLKSDPDLGHWFRQETVSMDIGKFCYNILKTY